MKLTILAFLVSFTSSTVQGQVIKDFFVPVSSKNKATYYTPSKTGGRTDLTRIICYVNNQSSYDITSAKMYRGTTTSKITRTIQFTSNEVKMIKSVSTTMFEANKQNIYNPPTIILKMPTKGQTVSWIYTDLFGETVQCTSSWTTVNFEGKVLKAIKIEQQLEGLNSKTIEYYVQGVGLLKTDMKDSSGNIRAFESFDNLGYKSTAK